MRTARVKADGAGYYHCMSRVIERRLILRKREKEVFRKMMRNVAGFAGVKILTYSVLGNHFHILTHVPKRRKISDKELLERMRLLYTPKFVDEYEGLLKGARKDKNSAYVEHLRNQYLYRMYDLSEFMKTLKQRFTTWYNRKNSRRGTLWEERFKSVMVQDSENALMAMASYIDLNAVRAGIVKDPKDYRFCGYGEASGGGLEAREGLGGLMLTLEQGSAVWGQVRHKYRRLLYVRGERTQTTAGFSYEKVEEVLAANGKLPIQDALRCRVRYFTDGVVLGSSEFVEQVFLKYRDEFGRKRETGARSMRNGEWGGLCTMRDLRLKVISIPAG